MRKILISALFASMACCAGAAWADDLASGIKAYQSHDYQQAKLIFSKLAEAGIVDAQVQLGDMYWYGDGMPVDLQQAEFWFKKAAQAGNTKAQMSLAIMKARVDRKSEIESYTLRFDGGNFQLARNGCVRPGIPAVSKTNAEINQVTGELQLWVDCYNKFAQHLAAATPATKVIPKDLFDIMSDEDIARALPLIDKVIGDIAQNAKTIALRVNEESAAWKRETEAYVAKANADKTGMSLAEYADYERSRMNQVQSNASRPINDRQVGTKK